MNDIYKTKLDIFHNAKVKLYPDGHKTFSVCNKPVYKENGYVFALQNFKDSNRPDKYDTDSESRSDNLTRTKNKIFDIAYMNDFKYFVTGTFRPDDKIDRYNIKSCEKALRKFLDNQVQRKGLIYLIIPEYHKDGAIHFHGLIKGDKIRLCNSGKRLKDGRIIYNWSDWKYGFSTAIQLTDNKLAVCKYITKYIEKDLKKIFGQFYLAGGKNLIRDVPFELFDTDYDKLECDEYCIDEANIRFKYYNE